jgi:hypothetical protein
LSFLSLFTRILGWYSEMGQMSLIRNSDNFVNYEHVSTLFRAVKRTLLNNSVIKILVSEGTTRVIIRKYLGISVNRVYQLPFRIVSNPESLMAEPLMNSEMSSSGICMFDPTK